MTDDVKYLFSDTVLEEELDAIVQAMLAEQLRDEREWVLRAIAFVYIVIALILAVPALVWLWHRLYFVLELFR